MKFEQALEAMRKGKKVSRDNRFIARYFVDALYIDKNEIMWNCIDDEDYSIDDSNLKSDDILAEDWEIVE